MSKDDLRIFGFILVWATLFIGEPDLVDALIVWLMK